VKKKIAITNEIVFPISGSYVYCTTSYILLYYNYYYAHIWHIYVYYLITTMTTNVLVCFYNLFSCIHTYLRFSWTRDDRRAHINVYIHYTLCVREEFILFIFCFLILILNIYTVKKPFLLYLCRHFLPLYILCYKCFFLIIIFLFFFIHNPNFSNSARQLSSWYDVYVFFCLPIDLKNRKK